MRMRRWGGGRGGGGEGCYEMSSSSSLTILGQLTHQHVIMRPYTALGQPGGGLRRIPPSTILMTCEQEDEQDQSASVLYNQLSYILVITIYF